MDLLTFIAEIAKASAWPAAAVTIAVLFPQQFRDLMARIKKGKVGPAEFEFEQRVRELESEAKEMKLPALSSIDLLPAPSKAADHARLTVMNAWLQVENAVDEVAKRHKLFNALVPRGSPHNMTALRKTGVVSPDLVSLYGDLRGLRNQTAHDTEFSPSIDVVVSYVRVAKELEAALRALPNAA